jgi:hypothetical protein
VITRPLDERQYLPVRGLPEHPCRDPRGPGLGRGGAVMRPFSYVRAADAGTAIALSGRARTTEVDLVRQDVLRPGLLVDINDLPLDRIEDLPDGGLRIERWHGPGSRPRRGRSRTGTNSLPLGSRMCRRRSSSPVPPSVSFPAKQTFELSPNIGSLSAVSYLPHLIHLHT